jgi:ABC-2 type transport system permease protein
MFFNTIKKFVKKEFIQTFRDKRMIPLLFIAPVVQLLLFGFAIRTDIRDIYVAYLDRDNSSTSREILRRVTQNEYFTRKFKLINNNEINAILDKNKAEIIIVFNPGFEKEIVKKGKAAFQIIISGLESNTASVAKAYLEAMVMEYNNELYNKKTLKSGQALQFGKIPFVSPVVRMLYNQDLKTSNYMVPAMLGMILMILTILLTTLSITREREMGTFELLVVSPIKPLQLTLGKTIPFAIIGILDVTLILLAGKLIFNVPIRINLFYIYLASFFFILTSLGTGLFISASSKTQTQAILTMLFILQPAFVLSGLMFPVENMPFFLQGISYLNPLTYYIALMRTMLLKGTVLWGYLFMLIFYSVAIFTFSALKFRKNIE